MKQFNKIEQSRFWSDDHVRFKGELVSDVTLSMAISDIGKNMIDIGAGSGALLRSFREKYKSKKLIIGVDLAPKSEEVPYGNCTNLQHFKDECSFTDITEQLSDDDLVPE
jgi:ubiquinone/menaquinone biosynthesis C-methylase UbiE